MPINWIETHQEMLKTHHHRRERSQWSVRYVLKKRKNSDLRVWVSAYIQTCMLCKVWSMSPIQKQRVRALRAHWDAWRVSSKHEVKNKTTRKRSIGAERMRKNFKDSDFERTRIQIWGVWLKWVSDAVIALLWSSQVYDMTLLLSNQLWLFDVIWKGN